MSRKKWIFFASISLAMAFTAFWLRSSQKQNSNATASVPDTSSKAASRSVTTTTVPESKPEGRAPGADFGGPDGELRKFLKSSDPQAQWMVSRSGSGLFKAISGGLIRVDISDPEKALSMARHLAGLMGFDPKQVVPAKSSMPATADSRSANFGQEIDGHSVFGSELNLFTRNQDGAIYYITNELHRFRDLDTRISYGLNEAEQKVMEMFAASREVKIEAREEKPVIVPRNENQGELCWQIQVRLNKPRFDRRLLFLSTRDLSLVRSVDLVVPN